MAIGVHQPRVTPARSRLGLCRAAAAFSFSDSPPPLLESSLSSVCAVQKCPKACRRSPAETNRLPPRSRPGIRADELREPDSAASSRGRRSPAIFEATQGGPTTIGYFVGGGADLTTRDVIAVAGLTPDRGWSRVGGEGGGGASSMQSRPTTSTRPPSADWKQRGRSHPPPVRSRNERCFEH